MQSPLPGLEAAPPSPAKRRARPDAAPAPAIVDPGPTLEFWVFGTPAPQGSKTQQASRTGKRYFRESSATTLKPWRHQVAQVALAERTAQRWEPVFEGALRMDLVFVMPRTQAMGKRAPRPGDAAKKPDRLKLARAVEDALRGVLFADDSQIVAGQTRKRIAELGAPTGARIRIRRA